MYLHPALVSFTDVQHAVEIVNPTWWTSLMSNKYPWFTFDDRIYFTKGCLALPAALEAESSKDLSQASPRTLQATFREVYPGACTCGGCRWVLGEMLSPRAVTASVETASSALAASRMPEVLNPVTYWSDLSHWAYSSRGKTVLGEAPSNLGTIESMMDDHPDLWGVLLEDASRQEAVRVLQKELDAGRDDAPPVRTFRGELRVQATKRLLDLFRDVNSSITTEKFLAMSHSDPLMEVLPETERVALWENLLQEAALALKTSPGLAMHHTIPEGSFESTSIRDALLCRFQKRLNNTMSWLQAPEGVLDSLMSISVDHWFLGELFPSDTPAVIETALGLVDTDRYAFDLDPQALPAARLILECST